MKAARIILCTTAGALVGLALSAMGTYVRAEGYLVPWRKLAFPSARLDELVLGTPATVYGRTSDGISYRCSEWQDGCWVQDEIPPSYPAEYTAQSNAKTCDLTGTAFRWLRVAPGTTVDCIQGTQARADCRWEFTYVLDRNGDVWRWTNRVCDDGRKLRFSILFAGFGTVLGLAVGTLVDLAREGSG
jgi:hypothetical protein